MKVRCISPHGGMHGGDERRGLPPAERGYVDNGVLGRVAVGDVVDAPDGFICDGFHFESVADLPPPPPLPAPASAGSLADLLGKGAQ